MEQTILVNIHRILVKIRYNIYDESNLKLLDIIEETLSNKYSNQEMIKMLRKGLEEWTTLIRLEETYFSDDLKLMLTDNEENLFKMVINYSIFITKFYLAQGNYEIANDIIDAIHVFPEIVIGSDKKSLKEYWNLYIKPVRLKWNNKIFDEVKRNFL